MLSHFISHWNVVWQRFSSLRGNFRGDKSGVGTKRSDHGLHLKLKQQEINQRQTWASPTNSGPTVVLIDTWFK